MAGAGRLTCCDPHPPTATTSAATTTHTHAHTHTQPQDGSKFTETLAEIGCKVVDDIDVFLVMDPASCSFGGEDLPDYKNGTVFKGLSDLGSKIKSHFSLNKHDKDNSCTTILIVPPEGCGGEKEVSLHVKRTNIDPIRALP